MTIRLCSDCQKEIDTDKGEHSAVWGQNEDGRLTFRFVCLECSDKPVYEEVDLK